MPKVHLPDGRVVNFPDSMSPDQISGAVYKLQAVSGGPETREGGALQSLGDTALKTAKGMGEAAIAPLAHPIETVKGLVRTAAHPLDTAASLARSTGDAAISTVQGLKGLATGDPKAIRDALTYAIDPEAGGQAIAGLAMTALGPKAVPPIVNGLRRIGTATSGGAEIAMAGAKGAASNLPFGISAPVRGAFRGMKGALEDRALASIESPENLARAQQAVRSATSRPAALMPEGYDPYMANTSALPTEAGEFGASASDSPTMPQGTFTKLPDGSWGISGSNLTPGEPVHVMNRAGSGRLITIDKILNEAGGKQTATMRGAESSVAEPRSTAGPTGSGVRSFSAGEERGIAELDRFFNDKYGTDHPTVGNGSYVEQPAAPTRMPMLTAAERDLVDKLFEQQQQLPTPRSAVTDPRRLLEDAPQATGMELGRLLERLARGR